MDAGYAEGMFVVGKIAFNTKEVLGHGSEGTFVYRFVLVIHIMQYVNIAIHLLRYSESVFYARQHICYSTYMLWKFRLSVRLSVCHTGGSVKNG